MRVGSLVKYTDAYCEQCKTDPKKLLEDYGVGIILYIDEISSNPGSKV